MTGSVGSRRSSIMDKRFSVCTFFPMNNPQSVQDSEHISRFQSPPSVIDEKTIHNRLNNRQSSLTDSIKSGLITKDYIKSLN